MIVVAIIGVLTVLAIVGYRRWVRSAHMTEANDIISSIRQGEERFYGETGGYLDVTGALGVGNDFPATSPGKFVTQWSTSCTGCKTPNGFVTLGVSPNAPVIFGYSVIADAVKTPSGRGVSFKVNGKAFDFSSLTAGAPWYVVEADANISGDGTNYTHVYGMSGSNQLWVDGEGN